MLLNHINSRPSMPKRRCYIQIKRIPCSSYTEEPVFTPQRIARSRPMMLATALSIFCGFFFVGFVFFVRGFTYSEIVLSLYGFKSDVTEEKIVAKLMQMYAEKVKNRIL